MRLLPAMMGDGAVVTPEEGVVVAPEDGTVLFVFDTKHALGFTTDSGIGMIIHVGIDTVKLEGKGFDVQVEAGCHVNKGDVLMKLDLDYLKANAPSVTTPVICTELKDNQKIRLITDGPIKAGELSTQLTPTRSNSYILKQFKGIGCHGDGGSSSKMRHIYREKDWKAHRCHYYGLQPPHEPYPPHGIKSRDRRKIKG